MKITAFDCGCGVTFFFSLRGRWGGGTFEWRAFELSWERGHLSDALIKFFWKGDILDRWFSRIWVCWGDIFDRWFLKTWTSWGGHFWSMISKDLGDAVLRGHFWYRPTCTCAKLWPMCKIEGDIHVTIGLPKNFGYFGLQRGHFWCVWKFVTESDVQN